jgi:hypothetical protein
VAEQRRLASEALAQALAGIKAELPAHQRDISFLEGLSHVLGKAARAVSSTIEDSNEAASRISAELFGVGAAVPKSEQAIPNPFFCQTTRTSPHTHTHTNTHMHALARTHRRRHTKTRD